jgi:beta-glucosidase
VEKPEHPPAGVQFADDILAGFERVPLGPGETKEVVIHVPLRQFQYWSTAEKKWVTPAGTRTIWVGGSSRDRRLEDRVSVE